MRSKGNDVDVARIATVFGGGGHRNASGFKVREAAVNEVEDMLLKELEPLVSGN